MNKNKIGFALIALVGLMLAAAFVMSDPIAQDLKYHAFADTQAWLFSANGLNVWSNLPFVLIGFFGFYKIVRSTEHFPNIVQQNKLAYFVVYIGTLLVGFGSAYYHYHPNNDTLLWDRLPIAITLMAWFSIVIGEFISKQKAKQLLIPLMIVGAISTLYWWFTEQQHQGDLRYYVIVQFFPVITIPIILLCFKNEKSQAKPYWILIGSYIVAKLFEHFDQSIFDTLGFISGHSLKHLAPIVGIWFCLKHHTDKSD